MKTAAWMIACALGSSPWPTSGQRVASVREQALHPHMTRLLDERGPSKGWVFFEDKAVTSAAQLRESLARAGGELHPRCLERRQRRRTLPGLVDARDIPVSRDHVQRVLATGVELVIESSWLNAVSVHGTAAQFRTLAELPGVSHIEPVRRGVLLGVGRPGTGPAGGAGTAGPGGFYGLSGPQLEQINLVAVHERGYSGSGVVIGVLDTGFHRGHEAFQFPGHEIDVVAEYDFLDDDGFTGFEVGDPVAQHNHGTMVLGTLAAYLPGELMGGAFDASYVLVKTEDVTSEYQQEEDFYVAGLQFIEAQGADVATSSLGYINWYAQGDLDGLTAVTTIAVNIATANGLHCCTAAGNNHHDADPTSSSLLAPSDAFEVITCGAVELDGQIADFSSDGPTADGRVKPEVLALGRLVMTNCAHADVDCTTDTGGTSFSTPLVASAVACLVQAHPDWTASDMRMRLFQSASDFRATGTFDPSFVRGYGILDALRAGFPRRPRQRMLELPRPR